MVGRIMKVEDISNGYSVRGPKCEPLVQNQDYYDNSDNLYNAMRACIEFGYVCLNTCFSFN